jgi:transposase
VFSKGGVHNVRDPGTFKIYKSPDYLEKILIILKKAVLQTKERIKEMIGLCFVGYLLLRLVGHT